AHRLCVHVLRPFSPLSRRGHFTTTCAVISGCSVQKYTYVPGLVKVWRYTSPLSRPGEVNSCMVDVTVCGSSSRFTHVTVVPTGTFTIAGLNLWWLITTWGRASDLVRVVSARSSDGAAKRVAAISITASPAPVNRHRRVHVFVVSIRWFAIASLLIDRFGLLALANGAVRRSFHGTNRGVTRSEGREPALRQERRSSGRFRRWMVGAARAYYGGGIEQRGH